MSFFRYIGYKEANRNKELASSLLYPQTPVLINYIKLIILSICKEEGGLTQEGEPKDEQIPLEVVGLMLDQGTAQMKPDF